MSGIVLRGVKGSELTHAELDGNFVKLNHFVANAVYIGPVVVKDYTARYYPPTNDCDIVRIDLSSDNVPTEAVVVDIKKSGVSIFNGNYPTLAVGSNYTEFVLDTPVAVNKAAGEYLTVSVLSGSVTNLNVRTNMRY